MEINISRMCFMLFDASDAQVTIVMFVSFNIIADR